MKRSGPIARKTPLRAKKRYVWKPKSRQTKTRTILYGKKYSLLRVERALLAKEHCEHCGVYAPMVGGEFRDVAWASWGGELCHLDRGAKRNSTLDRVRWLCRSCHDRMDGRDVKPCPPKS
jgi:hypothetical protein